MPKISSYTICHYGKDYLGSAIQSIYNIVDRCYVLYHPTPSHGHKTELSCPESRDELMASIPEPLWSKVHWVDTSDFYEEGKQRDFALAVASKEASLVLVLDYDEIWLPETLEKVLQHVWDINNGKNHLVNMRHMWRSFSYSCTDNGWPVRIIDTRHTNGVAYVPKELGDIWHFGYSIPTELLKYKLSCHGHKDELRPNWLEEKWSAWPPVEDCHPTNGRNSAGIGWWNPKPYDKELLPEIMKSHKWWGVDKIE